MASSSGAKFEIDKADGGRNSVIRASDPKAASSEEQNSGVLEAPHRASLLSLIRLFVTCWSGAESSSERSWYYSARIQRMIDGGELQSEDETSRTEAEIEASRTHWSEVVPAMSQSDQSGATNREYWEVLKRRKYVRKGDEIVHEQISKGEKFRLRGTFFADPWVELVVGEKLAEGGQAEIYAGTSRRVDPCVVKVFKGGSVLQHLERQIPPALLKSCYDEVYDYWGRCDFGATLLTDVKFKDRFAFVMQRCWGDLRKLIDLQMMHSFLNAGPPFSSEQVVYLMWDIARDMIGLHGQCPPILHNDLKAANVLVRRDRVTSGPGLIDGMYDVRVPDYECSVGVVGTGFWRAPEILQQLKDGVPIYDLKFSWACDVYSYGMMCYELVTGRIPFEDYACCPREGCELVLKGERPELPPDLDPIVKGIITSCWHPNPLERPTFHRIQYVLAEDRYVNFSLEVVIEIHIFDC